MSTNMVMEEVGELCEFECLASDMCWARLHEWFRRGHVN